MNKKTWLLFIVLVGIIALLSSSTSFYFFKSKNLEGDKAPAKEEIASSSIEATPTANTTSTPSGSAPKITTSSDKPSSPKETHTVQRNETLFEIAQKYNQTWTEIVAANGIEDADKIKAGQVLAIPDNEVVAFEVNQSQAEKLQKAVDAGKYVFRLSPDQTVISDAPPIYGINDTDQAQVKSKDSGSAVVTVKKEGETYEIKLTQPITKGDKGIWAIISIAPVR